MIALNRIATLIIIVILAVSSIVMVGAAFAVVQPSVPEFTVKQVDRSYDVPVTTSVSTDPFTGQQITHRSGGNHVENKTIDVTIKNQPFTSTDFGNGTVIQLYYSVRAKGHFGNWDNPSSSNGYFFRQVLVSTSDNKVMTLILGSENDILMGEANVYIPEGGQEDFQVEAEAGYLTPDYGGHIIPFPLSWDFHSFGDSGWSSTQTITG